MIDREKFSTALQLCKSWAEVQLRGGPMSLPSAAAGSKPWGYDLDLVRATYVETTMWFCTARPILVHVFVKGQELPTYPFRAWIEQPEDVRRRRPDLPRFETYAESLLRHGLIPEHWQGRSFEHAAQCVLKRFLSELEERSKCEPEPNLQRELGAA